MHRTTFRIDEEILAEAKALAARQHRSLNSVMEEALRRMLSIEHNVQTRPYVNLPTFGSPGDGALIDTSPAGLKRFLEEEDIERYGRGNSDDAAGH
jgi:hypothetical protein